MNMVVIMMMLFNAIIIMRVTTLHGDYVKYRIYFLFCEGNMLFNSVF